MIVIFLLTLSLVIGTLAYGIVKMAKKEIKGGELKKTLSFNLAFFIPLMVFAVMMILPNAVSAATDGTAASGAGLGYIAAALAVGLGSIGAGYAVGVVGSAALGAMSENQELFGKTILYVGLAEGLSIFGLIIAILILNKL